MNASKEAKIAAEGGLSIKDLVAKGRTACRAGGGGRADCSRIGRLERRGGWLWHPFGGERQRGAGPSYRGHAHHTPVHGHQHAGWPDGIDGLELARRAVELRPGLHVLYTTGGGRTDGMVALFVAGGTFLPKPYTRDQLIEAMQSNR